MVVSFIFIYPSKRLGKRLLFMGRMVVLREKEEKVCPFSPHI
jgi:hypothetical protein